MTNGNRIARAFFANDAVHFVHHILLLAHVSFFVLIFVV